MKKLVIIFGLMFGLVLIGNAQSNPIRKRDQLRTRDCDQVQTCINRSEQNQNNAEKAKARQRNQNNNRYQNRQQFSVTPVDRNQLMNRYQHQYVFRHQNRMSR